MVNQAVPLPIYGISMREQYKDGQTCIAHKEQDASMLGHITQNIRKSSNNRWLKRICQEKVLLKIWQLDIKFLHVRRSESGSRSIINLEELKDYDPKPEVYMKDRSRKTT